MKQLTATPKPSIALIGAGAAGSSLILALSRRGYPVRGVASRSLESAGRCARAVHCPLATTQAGALIEHADIVIIATPDGLVEPVCSQLAGHPGWRSGQYVIHLSGALGADALDTARVQGAHTLSMHPAQTFTDPEQGARSLKGAYFALEGDAAALSMGQCLVSDLGANAIEIPAQFKTLYHAALCVASNYLVGLADAATRLLSHAGVDKDAALALMLPLMQGAVDNLRRDGLPGALTGPISRGDADTVRKHLQTLQRNAPELLPLYRESGRQTQRVAKEKGVQNGRGGQVLDEILTGPGEEAG